MSKHFIDHFELQNVVGSGAQGEVYSAHDQVLDRRVALKIISSRDLDDSNDRRALREARSLAKLQHPNIVTLFGVTQQIHQTILVMEYVEGVLLSEQLKQGPIPLVEAEQIMRQLIDALEYASSRGLLHGDIKSSNIMIAKAGFPKLLDFGLAKITRADEQWETLLEDLGGEISFEGTIAYSAPEKFLGEQTDLRSEIFSLGAVFYEMIAGRSPFAGDHQAMTINNILQKHPAPLDQIRPDTPRWCQSLVDAMLEKNPEDRPRSMASLLAFFRDHSSADEKAQKTGHSGQAAREVRWPSHFAQGWRERSRKLSFLTILPLVLAIGPVAVSIQESEAPLRGQLSTGLDHVLNFHTDGAIAEAQFMFGRLVQENSDHAAANAGLAIALIREYTAQETDPALLRRASSLANHSLQLDPHLALANIAAAWAAEFNGDFDRAHELYDTAEALDPENPLLLEGRARAFRSQGLTQKAEAVLRSALVAHPEHRVFFDDLGTVLSQQGDLKGAERILHRGLELHPDNLQGYAALAHVQFLQDNTDQAIKTVQLGLQVGASARLYSNLGTYLFFEGRYAQAAKTFERALELDGNAHYFIFWANLADAYRWLPDKQKEALAAYQQAKNLLAEIRERRPNQIGIITRIALYEAKMGEFALANASLAAVHDTSEAAAGDLYRLATIKEILGDRKAALQFLEEAILAGHSLHTIRNDPELAELRQDVSFHLMTTNIQIESRGKDEWERTTSS